MKAKAETHLRSSLEIRERENVDDIDVAECLNSLGLLYFHDESFYEAKKYFERALIRMNQMKDVVNPIKIINCMYMKGSACFYLGEYSESCT